MTEKGSVRSEIPQTAWHLGKQKRQKMKWQKISSAKPPQKDWQIWNFCPCWCTQRKVISWQLTCYSSAIHFGNRLCVALRKECDSLFYFLIFQESKDSHFWWLLLPSASPLNIHCWEAAKMYVSGSGRISDLFWQVGKGEICFKASAFHFFNLSQHASVILLAWQVPG